MKYKCRPCDWRGHEDEVNWRSQYVNSEAWGVVKGQHSEYATCPECDSGEIEECEAKDEEEPNELSAVLIEIARAAAQ
jgi:hypothetical protein